MHLNRIKLLNFKGVRDLEIEPDGADVRVFGDNATGKTTIADAWSWLLLDKDSTGAADFDIKTLVDGEPEHGLNHEVEAELVLPGGEVTVLKKAYHEVWTKRRGAAGRELTGHTTDHFVDGVPVRKSEYEAAVAEIIDADAVRLLTDPSYFAEDMHWTDRRTLLLDVCGDISDSEVIGADERLEPLRTIMEKRKLDDHRKVVRARRTEINRELERIPVRVDEVLRDAPESKGEVKKLQKAVEAADAALDAAREERSTVAAGGGLAEKRVQLREIEAAMQERRTALRDEHEQSYADLRTQHSRAKADHAASQTKAEQLRSAAASVETRIKQLTELVQGRRERWRAIDSKTFDHDEPDTCAACGQKLPEGEVEAARAKAEAEFNQRKARHLKEIDREGQNLRTELDAEREKLTDLEAKLEAAEQTESAALTDERELAEQVEEAATSAPAPDEDAEYAALIIQRDELVDDIADAKTANAEALNEIDERIVELATAAEDARASRDDARRAERAAKRADELREQERELAAEYEALEKELYLMDEFDRAKARMLDEKINAYFDVARFRLFRVLVNGGLEPCCDVLKDGVPYGSGLNFGGRVQVGLDIIATLQDYFDCAPPIFVDQCESVTNLPEIDSQIIRLIVSEQDPKLRVEVD